MTKPNRAGITKQLKRELADLNISRAGLEDSIAQRVEVLEKLNGEQVIELERLRNLGYRIAETTNRIFARTSLPPQFIKARSALIRKMLLSRSERITVARQAALKNEIINDLSALQAACGHQFVFSYGGYEGSHSMDRDDSYVGHRICVLCNRNESSASPRTNVYTVLAEDGTRLVRRDLRNKKALPKLIEKEWFSVVFIHQVFEASAGYVHVIWPEVLEKGAVLKL